VSGRSGESGFTLMEVIVALGILGVALFALMGAFFGGMNMFDDVRESQRQVDLLERALSEAEVGVMTGELSGAEEMGPRWPDVTYSYEANPVSEEQAGLLRLTVTLEGPDEAESSIEALIYDLRRR
jgi:prepilin-type N-terminal cleavage/methylation domain-containing protein